MSVKQDFMKMLSTLQHHNHNSLEYNLTAQLCNISFNSTFYSILDCIDKVTNGITCYAASPTTSSNAFYFLPSVVEHFPEHLGEDSNRLKEALLELQKIYREIESETQKLNSLNYLRCIQYVESEKDLTAIINEVKQYEVVFNELFDKWRVALDSFSTLLTDLNPDDLKQLKHEYLKAFDTFCELKSQCFKIINAIETSLETYLINANNKLKTIESKNISSSPKGSATNSNYSHIHYRRTPQYNQGHRHLSASERKELNQLIRISHKSSFKTLLFEYIDETGMTDAQVYKAAGISKQVFSYIRNGKQDSLRKENVVSICVVLQLNTEKTLKLLASCGYGLSEYITFDRIISFCISRECYDVDEINDLLYEYHQQTICGT